MAGATRGKVRTSSCSVSESHPWDLCRFFLWRVYQRVFLASCRMNSLHFRLVVVNLQCRVCSLTLAPNHTQNSYFVALFFCDYFVALVGLTELALLAIRVAAPLPFDDPEEETIHVLLRRCATAGGRWTGRCPCVLASWARWAPHSDTSNFT